MEDPSAVPHDNFTGSARAVLPFPATLHRSLASVVKHLFELFVLFSNRRGLASPFDNFASSPSSGAVSGFRDLLFFARK